MRHRPNHPHHHDSPFGGRHWEKAFGRPLRPMDAAFYAYGADSPIAAVDPDWP